MSEHQPTLGPCCACDKTGPDVRNIMMLHKKNPIPGRGWGCLQCGLSRDGACYVLCDPCLEKKAEPLWSCRGWPGSDGRVPIGDLTGEHNHDLSKHPELQPHPLTGAISTCERCECCNATFAICEECEGDQEIGIETDEGLYRAPCPSCEGDGYYWLCERSCDEAGKHAAPH